MSDIPKLAKKIHVEETEFRSPMGESMLQKMGGSINYILDEFPFDMVGDVTYSMRTEAQVQAARGTGWVLCDGRSVVGSKYQSLTGQANIPDFRSLFLRGKNNGISTALGNPNGEVALGATEDDSHPLHGHDARLFSGSLNLLASTKYTTADVTFPHIDVDAQGLFDGLAFSLQAAAPPGQQAAPTFSMGSTGGNENVPKNVTLNIFVRIN